MDRGLSEPLRSVRRTNGDEYAGRAGIEMNARNLENLDTIGATFDALHAYSLNLFAQLRIARENLPRD